MIYGFLADAVLISHLIFIIFAAFGGLLVIRSIKFVYFHIPAVIWAFIVQWFAMICPLTYLEMFLRTMAGESGYSGGFIDHYASSLIYLDIGPSMHIFLAIGVLLLNLAIYGFVLVKLNRG
ncbi:MAG: DUF2784 domain-containing protein [Pyrinomonadaceae bacterium]|nr:DUF2784 domain-containing protein [Pyrinomonadaceae bacterium]